MQLFSVRSLQKYTHHIFYLQTFIFTLVSCAKWLAKNDLGQIFLPQTQSHEQNIKSLCEVFSQWEQHLTA